jgi:hypothetical protein
MILRFFFAISFQVNLLRKKDLHSIIRNTYGEEAHKLYRKYENTSRKLEKTKLDYNFYCKCKVYNIMPKFLRFKLFRRALQDSNFYKTCQVKLLTREINDKKKRIAALTSDLAECKDDILNYFPGVTRALIYRVVRDQQENFVAETSETHERKLNRLGIHNHFRPCDPNLVVHNFSSVFEQPS